MMGFKAWRTGRTWSTRRCLDRVEWKFRWKSVFLMNSGDCRFWKSIPRECGNVFSFHSSDLYLLTVFLLSEYKKLDPEVNLEELAKRTKNFSGAEIEGLVRAAQSSAMNRLVKAGGKVCANWSKSCCRIHEWFVQVQLDPDAIEKLMVNAADFDYALENDIKPVGSWFVAAYVIQLAFLRRRRPTKRHKFRPLVEVMSRWRSSFAAGWLSGEEKWHAFWKRALAWLRKLSIQMPEGSLRLCLQVRHLTHIRIRAR